MMESIVSVIVALFPVLFVLGTMCQPEGISVFEIPILFFGNMLILASTLGLFVSQLSLMGIPVEGDILSPWLSILIIIGAPFVMWIGWEATTYSGGCFSAGFSNAVRLPFVGFVWKDKLLWPYKEYEYHETYP